MPVRGRGISTVSFRTDSIGITFFFFFFCAPISHLLYAEKAVGLARSTSDCYTLAGQTQGDGNSSAAIVIHGKIGRIRNVRC